MQDIYELKEFLKENSFKVEKDYYFNNSNFISK